MKKSQWFLTLLLTITMLGFSHNPLEAQVTYVTDAGGYAYDESRAATNLAPAIALATVALVAIVAVAVQNSHDSSSSHSGSSFHGHFSSFSSSSSSG